jgi:hypothetical protein
MVMLKKTVYASLLIGLCATLLLSCKPINIFSPLVDPSKMNNEAKLDAGYSALSNGNYGQAVEYFSDVIESSSGDQLVEAYLGRGAAYVHEGSASIDSIIEDLMNGDLEVDNHGEIISQVVSDGEFTNFFDNVENAAEDYNSAMDNTTEDVDLGVLFEVYQINMMAATGIGARKIAADYNSSPWGPGDVTADEELDAIVDEISSHPYNIATWDDGAANGLSSYVDGTAEETLMMGYLTDAFDALKELKATPPVGMEEQDIIDMQSGINDWVTLGLGNAALS